MDIRKRFSIRHGIEPEPPQPLFEDAPTRLRLFILQTLQEYFNLYDVQKIVGRALGNAQLLANPPSQVHFWRVINQHIQECKWWEVYNLIEEMEGQFIDIATRILFEKQLNEVFCQESIGWRMSREGDLERKLPAAAHGSVEEVVRELRDPRFSPALGHVTSAYKAYNGHPRLDRDVCAEIFDGLESVSKEVLSMPTATFGDVLKKARSCLSSETISVLEKLYALANNHFRHGQTAPFALSSAETEFVYLGCLGAILLFAKLATE